MSVLRMAWIEARALHRVMGFWLAGFLLAWLLLIQLQEPQFFRTRGVPFYWDSVEALLVFVLALLPLIWHLGHGRAAAAWTLRGASSQVGRIFASWLCIIGYGALIGIVVGAAAFTLDRIGGMAPAWSQPFAVALSGVLPMVVLASLAPGLALLPLGRTQTIFVWLVLMALVLHFLWQGWPVAAPLANLLSVLQATAAGLLLSLAAALQKLRA